MIFLKRYKKYCFGRPYQYDDLKIHGKFYLYATSCGINPIDLTIRCYKSKWTIVLHFNTANRISIRFVGEVYSVSIHESYSLADGYKRGIITCNIVNGVYKLEKTMSRTFKCCDDTPAKMREAYYDLLKEQFICRIKV